MLVIRPVTKALCVDLALKKNYRLLAVRDNPEQARLALAGEAPDAIPGRRARPYEAKRVPKDANAIRKSDDAIEGFCGKPYVFPRQFLRISAIAEKANARPAAILGPASTNPPVGQTGRKSGGLYSGE